MHLGVVHIWRHQILGIFYPPPPLSSSFVIIWKPPLNIRGKFPWWRHHSRNPPQFHVENFGLEVAFLLIKAHTTVVMPTKIVTSRQLLIFLLFYQHHRPSGGSQYVCLTKASFYVRDSLPHGAWSLAELLRWIRLKRMRATYSTSNFRGPGAYARRVLTYCYS